jgi:hypothetical protein
MNPPSARIRSASSIVGTGRILPSGMSAIGRATMRSAEANSLISARSSSQPAYGTLRWGAWRARAARIIRLVLMEWAARSAGPAAPRTSDRRAAGMRTASVAGTIPFT